MNWIAIGPLSAIPGRGSRVVDTPQGDIALFRTDENKVYALLDRCPHRGGPLSQGIVYGNRVACPLHDWVIELQSGEVVAPDCGCTQHFPVKLEDGMVFIAM